MQDSALKISSRSFEELVEDLGIGSFPEKEKEEILSKLSEVVIKRVFVEAMERLGQKGREEYEDFIKEKPNSDEIYAFFSERISEFEAIAEDVIESLRSEIISRT